jgi:NAD dependent epimerase/dehydratase
MNLKNKKVLVTGADGFIGSHLVEKLVECGCQVVALSQYNSFNNWGWLEGLPCLKNIEVVSGDIRDSYFIEKIIRNIDIVFHLAALIAIPYSYYAPESYVQTNVLGTLNVLQAALKNNVQKVLHTSTSEVYGTAMYVPIDEAHPLQPQSPYSASKIAADSMALSFFNSFSLPVTIVRPFNTYGPRQSARAVIPTVINQILGGNKKIKLGNLSPTRDFNYVTDTCGGFIKIAESDTVTGEVVNIGSNYEISIGDTIDIIKKILDVDVQIITEEQRIRPQSSEVERLWSDNSKLYKLTQFKPQVGIEEGLRLTIEWFKCDSNREKYKVNIYNV